jgi:acetoin utilization deacetylase AcuC-like enzyme
MYNRLAILPDRAPMRLPVVHHPSYAVPLPEGHRFPITKFGALHRFLASSEKSRVFTFHAPDEAPLAWIERVHAPDYVRAVMDQSLPADAVRRIGLPLGPALARRSRLAAAGSVLAGRLALAHGIATHTAGGSHHAHAGFGAGFCVFNDVAVAARQLQAEGRVARVLVVDCDVHQGDGTATLFAGDETVFTLSVHGAGNFPVRKAASDLDVALPDGTDDSGYLAALAPALGSAFEQARPDLVFYNSGVDVHADDRLGRLALSDDGIRARDACVLDACAARGVPVAVVSGGGYGDDVDAIARRHAIVHMLAAERLAGGTPAIAPGADRR